jgi:hypothetical protein
MYTRKQMVARLIQLDGYCDRSNELANFYPYEVDLEAHQILDGLDYALSMGIQPTDHMMTYQPRPLPGSGATA